MKKIITLAILTCLIGTTAQANDACQYKFEEGYAHVVSVPGKAIVSLNVKYQNLKLDLAMFPQPPKPGQVFLVQIGETAAPNCANPSLKIIKRVQ